MSNQLIPPISEKTTITKARFIAAFNAAFEKINTISQLYDKFFASSEGRPTLAAQIEDELRQINDQYSELFSAVAGGKSKTAELNKKIEEIQAYHSKLMEGDESIQADIAESQERITDFYLELFGTDEPDDGGKAAELKAAIASIVAFDEDLNKADIGHRAKIEKAKVEILEAHKDLFGKDRKNNPSKIDTLNSHIAEANEFHEKIKNEISPFIDEKHSFITKLAEDIETKQTEVDSLLSETTVKTLSQGYREAMQIYGDPVYGRPKKGKWNWWKHRAGSLAKMTKHFVKFLGSYLLFIGPLVVIGWVFVTDGLQSILKLAQDGTVKFSGSEYIAYKLTIALPLLWVSWYGQKNISHRKRLFEEYNHKLRVVQMYLLFITKEESYKLNPGSRQVLENTLLATINRNPSQVYGKDETLLDKLLGFFKVVRGAKAPETPGSLTDELNRASGLPKADGTL